jgi:hypothetical protein
MKTAGIIIIIVIVKTSLSTGKGLKYGAYLHVYTLFGPPLPPLHFQAEPVLSSCSPISLRETQEIIRKSVFASLR